MGGKFTESVVEEAALQYFQDLGYTYLPGPDIAHDGLFAERFGYGDVLLVRRLKEALTQINKDLPLSAIDEAVKRIARTDAPNPVANNRAFHRSHVCYQKG